MKYMTNVIMLFSLCIMPSVSFAYCNPDLPEFTPSARFADNGDGTVTDLATGLTWKHCSEGQTWDGGACNGATSMYTWAEALQSGFGSKFAGKDDWRVPNIKEMFSIVERRCNFPAVNQTVFPGIPVVAGTPSAWYWTSTPTNYNWNNTGPNNTSYYIDFANGYNNNSEIAGRYNVRLVRGGLGAFPQSSPEGNRPVTGVFSGLKSGVEFNILRSVGGGEFNLIASGTSNSFIDSSFLATNTRYTYAITSDADPVPTIVKTVITPQPTGGGTSVPVMEGWWLLPGMLAGVGIFARRRKE